MARRASNSLQGALENWGIIKQKPGFARLKVRLPSELIRLCEGDEAKVESVLEAMGLRLSFIKIVKRAFSRIMENAARLDELENQGLSPLQTLLYELIGERAAEVPEAIVATLEASGQDSRAAILAHLKAHDNSVTAALGAVGLYPNARTLRLLAELAGDGKKAHSFVQEWAMAVGTLDEKSTQPPAPEEPVPNPKLPADLEPADAPAASGPPDAPVVAGGATVVGGVATALSPPRASEAPPSDSSPRKEDGRPARSAVPRLDFVMLNRAAGPGNIVGLFAHALVQALRDHIAVDTIVNSGEFHPDPFVRATRAFLLTLQAGLTGQIPPR